MGVKEGTHCVEHWTLYVSGESLNFTPEINTLEFEYYWLEFEYKFETTEKEGAIERRPFKIIVDLEPIHDLVTTEMPLAGDVVERGHCRSMLWWKMLVLLHLWSLWYNISKDIPHRLGYMWNFWQV